MDNWVGVILAAGEGSRMKSRIPKPLHRVCGKELIRHPVDVLAEMEIGRIVVVVSPSNRDPIHALLGDSVAYAEQPQPLGTAHALSCSLPLLGGDCSNILLLNADAPLVTAQSVRSLRQSHLERNSAMTFLTAEGLFAEDMGRVLRDEDGNVTGIVEARDCDFPCDSPSEVNAGVYCFNLPWLARNLENIPVSSSGERYLTALSGMGGSKVQGIPASDPAEAFGVNNRVQLAIVESVQRQRILEHWMLEGVTILDPGSVHIDAGVSIGQDTTILPNTLLQGSTVIGEQCTIGPNSVIQDSSIGAGSRITASMLEEAIVEGNSDVGPFSHLRPGAHLESHVHVGNYVEIKNTRMAAGAVSGHFSYLGDASIGAKVNIGAGTVTCNYDGKEKLRTVIGEGAFIGCDTMLVAPVAVGSNSSTGAGSVVTRDVPEGRLAVGVPARIFPRKFGE